MSVADESVADTAGDPAADDPAAADPAADVPAEDTPADSAAAPDGAADGARLHSAQLRSHQAHLPYRPQPEHFGSSEIETWTAWAADVSAQLAELGVRNVPGTGADLDVKTVQLAVLRHLLVTARRAVDAWRTVLTEVPSGHERRAEFEREFGTAIAERDDLERLYDVAAADAS